MRISKKGTALGVAVVMATSLGAAGFATEAAADDINPTDIDVTDITTSEIADGVHYGVFDQGGPKLHMMTADLDIASVDMMTTGSVADKDEPSDMAENANAVGVVNGDFFNNDDDDNNEDHTNAPVGPVINGGAAMSSAVPNGQKMGPARPSGASNTEYALAMSSDDVSVTRLGLKGAITTPIGDFEMRGLNQYALYEDSAGLFTSAWGEASRKRAVCGKDDDRGGVCSEGIEIIVENQIVTDILTNPEDGDFGKTTLEPGQAAVMARDYTAEDLESVSVGDRVTWEYELEAANGAAYDFAMGGIPLVRNGTTVDGLDEFDDRATRTAVGYNSDNNTLYMMLLEEGPGATLNDMAALMRIVNIDEAVNLDGGGSSLMGTRDDDGDIEVRNTPEDRHWWGGRGKEREVANAIGIFS